MGARRGGQVFGGGAVQHEAAGTVSPNPAVLSLAVESEIGQSGAAAALGLYEQWLGNRAAEEPGTLRRVARAFLYEWTRQATDSVAQVEALKALAREGDADAVTTLTAGAGAGGPVEARALASLGNAEAVDSIREPNEDDARAQVLRHPRARRERLPSGRGRARRVADRPRRREPRQRGRCARQDWTPGRHSAPAAALERPQWRRARVGRRFARQARGRQRQKRSWKSWRPVRTRRSAVAPRCSWPRSLTRSGRRSGRGLANDSDAATRLDAARLLAPYNPEFARPIFDSLLNDSNPAIRDLVGQAVAQAPDVGFPRLRQLLRAGTGAVKVAAADRVLSMTR